MKTIIVSGALANKALNGGAAWTRLSWILGFKKLGCRVYFVEQIDGGSEGGAAAFEQSEKLSFFKRVTEEFGLSEATSLIYQRGDERKAYGLTFEALQDIAAGADALINITGHLTIDALKRPISCKVYIDLDPGYTQFWHAAGNQGPRLAGHDFYFTVGENIGTSAYQIPTGDIRWLPTRQPVVLEDWPVAEEGDRNRFTTIASWRGAYGQVQFDGRSFGLKAHEFRKFVELPARVPQAFEIALDIHPAETKDLELLSRHKWSIVNPLEVVPDPQAFRSYVQSSGAEFSVAQGVYVETRSGWFSDRTTRYLASGKPALVQDTGFSRDYLTGGGLLAFTTLEEAVERAEMIAVDYDRHSAAARRVVEEYFDSDKVLGKLIETIGI